MPDRASERNEIRRVRNVSEATAKAQAEHSDLQQITRLKYYALKLFKIYLDQILPVSKDIKYEDLCAFGGKFNAFFERANKIILRTLS
jgi:hypothetical protein